MSSNTRPSLGGDIVGSLAKNPEVQNMIVSAILSLLSGLFTGLIAKIGNKRPPVSGPSDGGGFLPPDTAVPDDKIPVSPTLDKLKDYTSLKLSFFKAQYNRELFPDQYTDNNPMGLYRPAKQDVYNRRTKIWFDCTPFKGSHPVQTDEGRSDRILWTPVWHLVYGGDETKVFANKKQLHDTANGEGRPIQVVEGESVSCGFSPWDFAHGFLNQINVGDNEGEYTVWVEIPELKMKSDTFTFKVS